LLAHAVSSVVVRGPILRAPKHLDFIAIWPRCNR
jgi:hypothetical protein